MKKKNYYKLVIKIMQVYLGPAAPRFVRRHLQRHLDRNTDEIYLSEIKSLAIIMCNTLMSIFESKLMVSEAKKRLISLTKNN